MSRSKFRQSRSIPGKRLADVAGVQVGEVEVDVGVLGLGHLGGDRQRDDVAGRQLGERMIGGHESLAESVAEIGPFAAHRFGQEMAGRAGDVKHGGMELHEFHVAEDGARTKGHGVSVRRGDRGVGRFAIELAGSAGRQHDRPGPDQREATATIPDQDASALPIVRHEVDGEAILPDADVAARSGPSG